MTWRRALLRSLPAVFTLIVLGIGHPSSKPAAAPAPVAVFVLRHAEKNSDDPRDPTLSEAGNQRAGALLQLLQHGTVTHFFATEYRRTQSTLEPLAGSMEKRIEIVPAVETAQLIGRLRSLPAGSVAVVAGHSNTVPAIVEGLGGTLQDVDRTQRGPLLREHEYDRLFLVTLPAGDRDGKTATVTEMRLPPKPWSR